MTRAIAEAGKKFARPDVEVMAVNPERGPASIEGFYDDALAAPGVLEEVRKALKQGFDAIIIACYGDPALYAAREIAEIPIVGIAEASMLMACMLGHKFSVITILERFKTLMEEVVKKYGLEDRCASVSATNIAVLDLEKDREETLEALMSAGRKAVEEDGAEVLCLGCAGMVGFDTDLEKALGVPVIDPVVAALKFSEALVDYGKKTSKIMTFRPPQKKEIKGFPEILQP
jgi:allantoin racemase